MRLLFYFVVSVLWMFSAKISFAQKGYIYIEGIKGLPMRLVVDGESKPMYNKNFLLHAFSAVGEHSVEIQFDNEQFQNIKFVADVIENAAFGFKLSRTNDNRIYLIDLVNNGNMIEPNSPTAFAQATMDNQIYFHNYALAVSNNNKEQSKKQKRIPENRQAETQPTQKQVQYGVIEVYDSSNIEGSTINNNKKIAAENKQKTTYKPITNTCNKIASESEVSNFVNKILVPKANDEARILSIKKRTFTGCLTVEQIMRILPYFDNQTGKFEVLKFLRNTVADTNQFEQFYTQFKSEAYKQKIDKLFLQP